MKQKEENRTAVTFGTGGIRAVMGSGGERINNKTIRRAASALAMSLPKENSQKKILIGYDTRHHSAAFAKEAALTLNAFGFATVLWEKPCPVPLLSFVLKREDHLGGIMITASHNPKEYNGFKVYNARGGQITPDEAAKIEKYLPAVFPDPDLPTEAEAIAKGLFFRGGKAEEAAYLSALTRKKPPFSDLTVAATPLHGAAWELLPAALRRCGHRVIVPAAQATPNGDFPTVAAPNPEDPAVFDLAAVYAKDRGAELLLAADGDGDRCGACVKHNGSYHYLSGNDTAAILLFYLTQRYRVPADGYIVKTAVSGDLAAAIAKEAGLSIREVPTGFKYIGAEIIKGGGTFFAGYEESGGFLFGGHAADKDGIQGALLLAEAAAHYKKEGKTLLDIREEIFCRFGREYTATRKFTFAESQKNTCPKHFGEITLRGFEKEIRGDTVFFTKGKSIKIALRPSGTEPILKLYIRLFPVEEAEISTLPRQIEEIFSAEIERFIPQTEEC